MAKRFTPEPEPCTLPPPRPVTLSAEVRYVTLRVPLAPRFGLRPPTYFQLDLPGNSRAALVMGELLAGLKATGATVLKYGDAAFPVDKPAEALRWLIEALAAAAEEGQ